MPWYMLTATYRVLAHADRAKEAKRDFEDGEVMGEPGLLQIRARKATREECGGDDPNG